MKRDDLVSVEYDDDVRVELHSESEECSDMSVSRAVFRVLTFGIIVSALITFTLFGCYSVRMSSARRDLKQANAAANMGNTDEALQYFRTALDKGREAIYLEKAALKIMWVLPFPIIKEVNLEADEALDNIIYCEESIRELFPDKDF